MDKEEYMGIFGMLFGAKHVPDIPRIPRIPLGSLPIPSPAQGSLQEIEEKMKELQAQKDALIAQQVALSDEKAKHLKEQIKGLFFTEPWTVWPMRDSAKQPRISWKMYSKPLAEKIKELCGETFMFPSVVDRLDIPSLHVFSIWCNSNYVSMDLREPNDNDTVPKSAERLAKAIREAGIIVDMDYMTKEAQLEQDLADGLRLIMQAGTPKPRLPEPRLIKE